MEKMEFIHGHFRELKSFNHPFEALVIESCNGQTDVSFSRASLVVRGFDTYEGISELYLYRGAYLDFNVAEKNSTITDLQSFQTLKKFIEIDFRKHQNCLRKLREAKKERKISECDVQTTLAVHLFGPLVVNSKVIADDQSYNKGSPKCINCDQTVETGNTSIGNISTWHGVADILVAQTLIKVESNVEEDEVDPDGSGEPRLPQPPTRKRRKLDGEQAGENQFTDVVECKLQSSVTYMPDGPDKLSVKWCSDSTLNQVLAQTIVNGFLQAKLHPELKKSFIPSFLASESYITIHMYNPGLDVLITQSAAMAIFDADFNLNTTTLLSVWLALNMHNFSKAIPNDEVFEEQHPITRFPKSRFHQHMAHVSKLETYENDMEMPLEVNKRPPPIRDFKLIHSDQTTDYAKKCLQNFLNSQTESSDQSVSLLHKH